MEHTSFSILIEVGIRGVDAKVLDRRLEGSKFELQSHDYIHSRITILGKIINSLITPTNAGVLLQ